MQPNIMHMVLEFAAFAVINLAFMVVLFIRLRSEERKCEPFDPALLEIDPELANAKCSHVYFKWCSVLAAGCFVFFILVHNMGISCNSLDKRTQCVCYALEAKYARGESKKISWAKQGRDACPTSEWFPEFLKKYGV